MTDRYYRPIPMTDAARPEGAFTLAGGWCWFDRAEVLDRAGNHAVVAARDIPADWLDRLVAPRADFAGVALDRPRMMGIVNITPDSFSDGGHFLDPAAALTRGACMAEQGAAILDLGGESTRPGAAEVPESEELRRVLPVISALTTAGVALSIDTRKAAVARAALAEGARIVNDVSGLDHDPGMAAVVAGSGAFLCLMHMRGTPQTMQREAQYDDVLLDVYDVLAAKVAQAEAAGIPRGRIAIDPGIGFAKTEAHNLAILRRISLFHGIGCAILLGVSRKTFIGRIGGTHHPEERGPGTSALTLAAAAQGVQIHRLHVMSDNRQALALWQAVQAERG